MRARLPEIIAIIIGSIMLFSSTGYCVDQDPGSVGAIMCWSGIILGSLITSVAIGSLTSDSSGKH